MTAPKAILFDLDDTLLDMYSAMHSSWQEICADVAPRLGGDAASLREAIRRESAIFWADEETVAEYRVRPLDSRTYVVRLALLSEGLDESSTEEIARRSLRGYLERVAPFDDSIETLEALRSQGYRLGMVTNGSSETQREKIARWNLANPTSTRSSSRASSGGGSPTPRCSRRPSRARAPPRTRPGWSATTSTPTSAGRAPPASTACGFTANASSSPTIPPPNPTAASATSPSCTPPSMPRTAS